MSYQQLSPGQTYPETPINENMEALGQAFCFAHNKPADTDLAVGFSGGTFNGATLTDDVLTCTDDDETYIVALRVDGTLSAAITTTNWNNTTTYGRVARVTFVSGALTAFADERFSVGGIFAHLPSTMAAANVSIADAGTYFTGADVESALQEVGAALAILTSAADVDTDFSFTSDAGSTADSDPGAGLFKWNHATQASSTFLYFDDSTADAVSMTTYFNSLPKNGMLRLVQDDDNTKWQEWAWTAAPVDGTGYRKFAVTLQASGGSIADNKACSVRFDASPGATVPVVMAVMFPGAPTASQLVGIFAAPAGISAITVAPAFAGSSGIALTAATAQTDIDVRKNAATSSGGSSVGTIRWAASGTVPTFIAASGFELAGGADYLSFWAPATPDATLASFGVSIYGTREA